MGSVHPALSITVVHESIPLGTVPIKPQADSSQVSVGVDSREPLHPKRTVPAGHEQIAVDAVCETLFVYTLTVGDTLIFLHIPP